jgi:hypothetical protein
MREYNRLLNTYKGKTVDELLAITGDNEIDFLFAIELAVQQKSERVGAGNLTEEERIVLAVEGLEREVNNGGYSQFFTNSSGEYAPVIVDALLRIGCPETAGITSRAIAVLGITDLSPESLHAACTTEDDARDAALDECDQMYYTVGTENIGGQLIEFVKANKAMIQP